MIKMNDDYDDDRGTYNVRKLMSGNMISERERHRQTNKSKL